MTGTVERADDFGIALRQTVADTEMLRGAADSWAEAQKWMRAELKWMRAELSQPFDLVRGPVFTREP